jgi:hypothetical protein
MKLRKKLLACLLKLNLLENSTTILLVKDMTEIVKNYLNLISTLVGDNSKFKSFLGLSKSNRKEPRPQQPDISPMAQPQTPIRNEGSNFNQLRFSSNIILTSSSNENNRFRFDYQGN